MSSPSGPDFTKGDQAPPQQTGWGAPPPQQPGWGTPPPPSGYQQYGAPGNAQYGAPGAAPGYSPAPPYAGPAGGGAAMSPADAVRSVLGKYADFSGRARRAEYWWFVLAYVVASIVASIVDQVLGFPLATLVLVLGLIVPSLAVAVRRLHDTGRSGWWLLIGLIPFGGIVVLVFACLDSQPGPNQWGPSPKYASAGWGPGGY